MNRMQKYTLAAFLCAAVHWPGMLPAGDDTIATVNGQAITMRQLEEAVDRIVPRSAFHGNISDDQREEYREKALETLIVSELQYQNALELGLKVDDSSVKDQMKLIRESFRTKREYQFGLEKAGLNEDQLRARIKRNLLVRAAIERITGEPSQMSDQAVKEYYESHPERFAEPESARIRIISTPDEGKMNEVLARIKKGEDFAAVASQLSDDAYRIKGGDLGFVRRGMIYPDLEERVFSLKPGARSDVIKSEGTLYLVKVEEKRPPRTVPFSEAREGLKKDLENKRKAELLDTWVSGLRAKADIQIRANVIEKSIETK